MMTGEMCAQSWRRPMIITEELPPMAMVAIDGDPGTTVWYIDLNHGIRRFDVNQSGRFIPNFVVPDTDEETIAFLKDTLRKNDPDAQEIRHMKVPHRQGFFLCSVNYHEDW